jgi:enoyl-CoA hydratase
MGFSTILLEKSEGICTLTLNRPEARNAIDREHADALVAAFREFDADDGADVAVLFGAGGTFCAGADLKAFDNRAQPDGDGPMGPSRMVLSKPVIAAVAGHAVAGGLELALWCDLRVVEEDAVFGVFCRRFGVPLIDGGTLRLPRLIGLSRALDLILTARTLDTAEALAFGLVDRAVPRGAALDAALELGERIASFPWECVFSERAAALQGTGLPLADGLRIEADLGRGVVTAARAGAARFASGAGRGGVV